MRSVCQEEIIKNLTKKTFSWRCFVIFAKVNPRFCKRRCFILIQFYERFTFLSPVLCNHTLRATSIRRYILGLLVYFLTPSLISFIGLLPRFVFFVKVPFRSSENNHFHVPPLTFFRVYADLASAFTCTSGLLSKLYSSYCTSFFLPIVCRSRFPSILFLGVFLDLFQAFASK